MEQIVAYLEKLGYEVEEQGRIKHFLLVLREGLPIGFILPDFSVKMISGENLKKSQMLQSIVSFVKQNRYLQTAGQGTTEYIITTYRGSQLTTFFDLASGTQRYALYLINESGEVADNTPTFDSYDAAMHEFILQTNMIDLKTIATKEPLRKRWRRKLIHRLMRNMT